jgi:hypothetical protein
MPWWAGTTRGRGPCGQGQQRDAAWLGLALRHSAGTGRRLWRVLDGDGRGADAWPGRPPAGCGPVLSRARGKGIFVAADACRARGTRLRPRIAVALTFLSE